MVAAFDFQPRTRVVFGPGALKELGRLASELGFRRTLLVSDRGMVAAGYVGEASRLLAEAGVAVFPFHDFHVNPDTSMVESGRIFAAESGVDSIIGLGGGSSMDCAKGVNFVLTNGGRMRDYWGYGKAAQPLLPMIGVPTTAGTGSEAQSYALISDAGTHVKMACGDPQAAFRIALLDPQLTVSQPPSVTAAAGYDALSHAVETYVTTKRNAISECFSREAWRLLSGSFERVLTHPGDLEPRAAMQLGAHLAGAAIENSMLGATHACANPLTARFGTTHGLAIASLLAHVVRWNSPVVGSRYRELSSDLAAQLADLAAAGGLPTRVRAVGAAESDLPRLAQDAGGQWTGRFNPRPFDAAAALEVYQCAY
jgi:alcohol dehydrogenase